MNLAQTFNPWVAALVVALTALISSCATAPAELTEAREAYADAKRSPATQYAPAELREAEEALYYAEEAFKDEGDDEVTRALAYRAVRKAQLAQVQADIFQARQQAQQAERQLMADSEEARRQLVANLKEKQELAQMTQEELAEERARLDQLASAYEAERQAGEITQSELEAKRQELEQAQRDLETEREARLATEQDLEEVRAELEKVAQIKEDARRMVITLNGSVLFELDKSVLLPLARQRLDQVAEMLNSQPGTQIVVEGHTDSQGAEDYNRSLSEDRAQAVRDYLVRQGVASERIEAVGVGESEPIASNEDPEGRANNRRVEIIVDKRAESATLPPSRPDEGG